MTEGLEIFGRTVFDTLFIDWKIMVPVAVFSIIMFFVGLYLQLDKWGRGVPEGATKPAGAWGTLKLIVHRIFERGIGPALGIIILDGLFQRRTWRRRKTEWLMHILIFWGWVGLFMLTVAAAAAEFYGPFILNANYTFFANFWKSIEPLNELFAYMLTAGIVIAVIRRIAFADVPPARFTSVDWIAIIGIGIVVVTGFWAQGLRGSLGVEERMLISAYEAAAPSFFNNAVVLFHEVFTLLFCVAYLPFSKLFHMLVTPLIIMINKGGYVEVNP